MSDQTSLRGCYAPEAVGPREQALIWFAEAWIARDVAIRIYLPSRGDTAIRQACDEFEMAKTTIDGMIQAEINRIVLSPAESIRFAEALLSPDEPNENLRRACRQFDDDSESAD